MKTSYFANRDIATSGLVSICITARPPDWMPNVKTFKALAPAHVWLKLSRPEYERCYAALLEELDARFTYEHLIDMANGQEPVLLCYEAPPFTEAHWCHRRLVAEWFEASLDIIVEELPPYRKATKASPQLSLF